MDEPVRHLVAESDLDFNPDCSDVRQLMDPSFPLERDLAEALRLRKLRVEYQPQFDLSSGQGCGVEALARWVRSTGEAIAPSVFIRLAERSGLIRTLGEWVLQSACETAGAWCSRANQQTTLSVNVSALQIDEEFCGVIERTLEQTGFPAKQLELEITESALIANPALSIDYLKAWKQLGVRIAMDDFGTGYSSLGSLSRLPVDRLKLDRSLIHRMTMDRKGAAVVRLIVSLGAELDMEVIAEGVETEEQLRMLTDLGCPQAQGYLLGRPMAAEQVQVALAKTWGNRALPPGARFVNAVGELQRVYRSAAISKRFTMSSYGVMATPPLGSDA
ncbi:MAG TPA: EAL domain-containing protein [Steroidobacteraceae bacterium]|nr:EAL domain-containing protein [Steroidobacteraceae bacterium]